MPRHTDTPRRAVPQNHHLLRESTLSRPGPIKVPQLTVPFYTARTDTGYQQLASIEDRANSTYEAALIKIVRYGGHGLNFHAHYLYAHATDWNPERIRER